MISEDVKRISLVAILVKIPGAQVQGALQGGDVCSQF
jgi:hypothetical protein